MSIHHSRQQRTQRSQSAQGTTCTRNPLRAPRALRSLARIVFLASVIAGFAASGVAQTIRGTLTGTVSDSSGGVVSGATVTATNAATGIADSVVTNQQGGYTMPLLPPGNYNVTIELPGFKRYVRSGVVIEIAQTTRLDAQLQIGAVSEVPSP